jgi:hypothetical protein
LWLLSFGSFSQLVRISSSTCGYSCKSALPARCWCQHMICAALRV